MTYKRLTQNEVDKICSRYEAGISMPILSKEFGVSVQAIQQWLIKRGVKRRSQQQAQTKHTLNHNAFDILTEQSIYWIGFLLADGNISHRKTGSPEVAIALSKKDRTHLIKLRQFLGSSHALIDVPSVGAARFSVRSEKLVNALAQYGVKPRKSFNAKAPDIFLLNKHFWRGVIDGDGHLGIDKLNRPRLSLVGSEQLMRQFLSFVLHYFPNCMATVRPHKSIFRVELVGSFASGLIKILYTNSSIALDRKSRCANRIMKLAESS